MAYCPSCGAVNYSYNWLGITNYPCENCSSSTFCKVHIPGKCVMYNGPALTCLGFTEPTDYDTIIAAIDAKLCELEQCADCESIVISDVYLPTPIVDAVYSFQLSVAGSDPITITNIVKPDWMTISFVAGQINFNGTCPQPQATTYVVSFTLTNGCSTINKYYEITSAES